VFASPYVRGGEAGRRIIRSFSVCPSVCFTFDTGHCCHKWDEELKKGIVSRLSRPFKKDLTGNRPLEINILLCGFAKGFCRGCLVGGCLYRDILSLSVQFFPRFAHYEGWLRRKPAFIPVGFYFQKSIS